jgi:hypothetical protein
MNADQLGNAKIGVYTRYPTSSSMSAFNSGLQFVTSSNELAIIADTLGTSNPFIKVIAIVNPLYSHSHFENHVSDATLET